MTLPNDHFVVLRSDHFEVKVMGPSDEWIGALSRSISTAGISKMFALVLPSLATNQLKLLLVASRIGSERQHVIARLDRAQRSFSGSELGQELLKRRFSAPHSS
jgi:hypothetical protein